MNFLISFGLLSADNNWRLLKYIDVDLLSILPLTDFQIDEFAPVLNWKIMSTKEIPGNSIVKYADKIDWNTFLQNEHKKEISALLAVAHKIIPHAKLFNLEKMRKLYYNKDFILVFPEYVDFNWCAKNIRLTDYILIKYWNKFDVNVLSEYQPMSPTIHKEKLRYINWRLASRWPIEESFLEEIMDLIDIKKICRYQRLSERFILKNRARLDMCMISLYQAMSEDFIMENLSVLSLPHLALNKNYNLSDTIQFASSTDSKTRIVRWFIIYPSYISRFSNVNILLDPGIIDQN